MTTPYKKLLSLSLLLSFSLAASEHTTEALALKNAYLKNNQFIEEIKAQSNGKIEGLHKQINTHFSLNSESKIKGTVQIEKLTGMIKVPIAKSTNLLNQNKTIRVLGSIEIAEGELTIFSPVDMDFWQMAKLFISHADKKRPKDTDYKLKGYLKTSIASGKIQNFNSQLLSIGPNYFLLLHAPKEAKNIKIVLK